MKTIWKFPLVIQDVQNITGPGARVISADLDPSGALCVWAKVDTDKPGEIIEIAIRGTGHALPVENFEFVDTVRTGQFMWHVFAMHEDQH